MAAATAWPVNCQTLVSDGAPHGVTTAQLVVFSSFYTQATSGEAIAGKWGWRFTESIQLPLSHPT